MAKFKLKKGDRVKVIAGKDRGAVGEIIAVHTETQRVTVQGVNIVKHHKRDNGDPNTGRQVKGGIIASEASIHVSNVQLLVKDGDKEVLTRVGSERKQVTKRRPDGSEYEGTRGTRIARKTGKEI
ncbi:large subunit ribosomal protein L24 [Propionibacterium cyclohexanicum]|uniref:Large ribosomal subunit protein uL24 n=1 Tax=Propionibacterium cyclohexanicum TaxID=64702 RepID=A0A1H9S2T2_9ACTN|nr:50S ribosomal protein L24 [Propionibacterium cyclohexanicum]SER79301.1 large subunit ribosomal protein L24 [Propionibacterium cyclohexanicum]